jgi:hypothetical protein
MAIIVYIVAFLFAAPVDIDGIREPVAGSLIYVLNEVRSIHHIIVFTNQCALIYKIM